jgi:hypothetical protein
VTPNKSDQENTVDIKNISVAIQRRPFLRPPYIQGMATKMDFGLK